jgi:hypothetical protein
MIRSLSPAANLPLSPARCQPASESLSHCLERHHVIIVIIMIIMDFCHGHVQLSEFAAAAADSESDSLSQWRLPRRPVTVGLGACGQCQ